MSAYSGLNGNPKKNRRHKGKRSNYLRYSLVGVSCFFLGSQTTIHSQLFNCDAPQLPPIFPHMRSAIETGDSLSTSSKPPPTCSREQLLAVRHQLPPELCLRQVDTQQPYLQKCSFTTATQCPKASWLDHHYSELQKHFKTSSDQSSFLGISVGCNKGFDAINALRMGTFDKSINKVDWKTAMEDDGSELHLSVCHQDDPNEVFRVDDSVASRPGEMHCIEPMPQTYQRLLHSAQALGYVEKGLTVTHSAVSKESGELYFPVSGQEGIENLGLESCAQKEIRDQYDCKPVPVVSLQEFVTQKVRAPASHNINILTIDVEGFDGNVLLGATPTILRRVEYLEFEYNWMGAWKEQHLYDITQMLNEIADMTCYWAGMERLWRITNCWMAYFDLHAWSNVACVNRRLVPSLASKMEEIFLQTLKEDNQWVSKRLRNPNPLQDIRDKYPGHILLSKDPEELTKHYYSKQ